MNDVNLEAWRNAKNALIDSKFPCNELYRKRGELGEETLDTRGLGVRYTTSPKHKASDRSYHATSRTLWAKETFMGFDAEFYEDKCVDCGIVKQVGVIFDDTTNKCFVKTFFNLEKSKSAEKGDFFS